ncbi:MAG: PilZ domain-containing protein [Candidatus Nitrospinota bacterium M3_3B_026]
MEERRRHPRREEGAGAVMRAALHYGDDYREIEAELVNYSEGGAQLVTTDNGVRSGMLVVMKSFDGTGPFSENVEGKVVWVANKDGKTGFGLEYFAPLVNIPPFF